MTIHGTVIDGTVVLDDAGLLPDGARVEVTMTAPGPAPSPLAQMLLRHAGKAVGLPEDLAAQHDHYLHGTPKR